MWDYVSKCWVDPVMSCRCETKHMKQISTRLKQFCIDTDTDISITILIFWQFSDDLIWHKCKFERSNAMDWTIFDCIQLLAKRRHRLILWESVSDISVLFGTEMGHIQICVKYEGAVCVFCGGGNWDILQIWMRWLRKHINFLEMPCFPPYGILSLQVFFWYFKMSTESHIKLLKTDSPNDLWLSLTVCSSSTPPLSIFSARNMFWQSGYN